MSKKAIILIVVVILLFGAIFMLKDKIIQGIAEKMHKMAYSLVGYSSTSKSTNDVMVNNSPAVEYPTLDLTGDN